MNLYRSEAGNRVCTAGPEKELGRMFKNESRQQSGKDT
jgi:hypothetical protein